MGVVTIELSLPDNAAMMDGDKLSIDFGNGVRLNTTLPPWIKAIRASRLHILLDVEGEPPDAHINDTPVK